MPVCFYVDTICCGGDHTAGGEEVGGENESAAGLEGLLDGWYIVPKNVIPLILFFPPLFFLALLLVLFYIIVCGAVLVVASSHPID